MRIALVQQRATRGKQANRARGLEAAEKAAAQGAQLICFAELAFEPFYPQRPTDGNVADLAEPIPGPTTEAFAALASRHQVAVVLNLFERDGEHTYDASPVIDVDGRLLGAPREIRWQPAGGRGSTITWGCATAGNLRDGDRDGTASFLHLTSLLNHQARGRLEFVFDPREDILADAPDSAWDAPVEISGRYLDGRPFEAYPEATTPEDRDDSANMAASLIPAPETVEEVARGFVEDRARLLKSDRHNLSLSPDLLIGWPNPFNDVISIRFTVPRTMKEAFVWKDNKEQPTEINLEGEVPWPGGQPGVSVKIYSINGQELVTLHSATLGAGDYTARWNGTDAFGRKVASGTYFCKLQMDDWSVTRRLVFIR